MKKEKPTSETEPFNLKKEILSWIEIFAIAALLAFCINTFLIANSVIPSASMENTIMTHDRVIGSRLTYKFHEPERGDVVIFIWPDTPEGEKGINYVKRIIGLPGDTVDIRDGHVYLNGSQEPLEEPYLKEPMRREEPMHFEVPEGCYFMMGDNRNVSLDARYWTNTYVEKKDIIAKVYFSYFPKIHSVK